MYEAWRILKKNPFIYNPRSFAYIFVGFTLYGVVKQMSSDYIFGYEHYEEDHPHDHNEALRQWARQRNIKFREYVLAQRAIQDQQLRAEAGL